MQFFSKAEVHPTSSVADPRATALLALGTAVPEYGLTQVQIGEWMANAFSAQPAISRAVRTLHAQSGIEIRHSCCPEYLQPTESSRFAPSQGANANPTTAERMAIYTREAPVLGTAAASQALERFAAAANVSVDAVTQSVTHLVVVSCTGFFAPGLDFVLAQRLGLASTLSRTLIGFMGCSAAFNGLRTAYQIVGSQPDARVLVVCVELCSLHIQQNSSPAHLIAMSLFADGAAACLVGKAPPHTTGIFQLDAFHTETQPETASEMVWEIGDHGFVLHLSPKIPEHVASAAPATLHCLFPGQRPAFWAIHPGGRAIVDRLQKIFELTPTQVAASRAVLRRYGNLSSATILFVLEDLQQRLAQGGQQPTAAPNQASHPAWDGSQILPQSKPCSGVAMAFGPGLVIEMARLSYVPAPARE
ncbi:MAG: type III polyketide synthase [Caldilineaceae bacterium]